MTAITLLVILITAIIAFFVARSKAGGLRAATGSALHSMPAYHGLATGSAALVGGGLVAAIVGWFLPTQVSGYWVPALAAVGGLVAAFPVFTQISKEFRARNGFERFVKIVLMLCSAVAVLTTVGIVASVAFEALVFFREISILQFLFTDHWAPTSTPPSFGFLPLLKGTLLITLIAILVAGPIGLFSAI